MNIADENSRPVSIAQIVDTFEVVASVETDLVIKGLCGLSDNLAEHLSFITGEKYIDAAAASAIPAFVTREQWQIPGKVNLIANDPEREIARIACLFSPESFNQATRMAFSAQVSPTATLGRDVSIGPNCVIGDHVVLGDRTQVHANSIVFDRTTVGADTIIHPNVTIRHDSIVGERVILNSGVVIGSDGYGFVSREGRHEKIPQLGNVVIEDDVEIGANSTVDRGRFTATKIGRGTKIDNLVMIAHNVQIGEDCLIVAQCGISGSTVIGDRVTFAGQVGVVGHLTICDDVTVLGQSMIAQDIREPGVYAGSPCKPASLWRRAVVRFYKEAATPRGKPR